MYAVILSGGKQHRVTSGEVLKLEKIEQGIGEQVVFDQVLMTSQEGAVQLGTPYIAGHKVIGEVVEQGRGDKIRIIKFRRRKHHMKHQGHRQYFTAVKILSLGLGDEVKAPKPKKVTKAKAEAAE
jgi:large subunit ribosomal protein L21